MKRQLPLAAALLATLLSTAVTEAVELPPSITVAKQQLVLNGQGTREKYFLDLYEAGLYVTQPASEARAIIGANQLMAIRIVITSKLVSQEKLVESLQEGFHQSTNGKLEPIQTEVGQFRRCFADAIVRGDVFDIIYVPDQGTVVLKNGKLKGTVAGMPFKQALFGIWLGNRPADADLRQALLGAGATLRK